ncbi:MAG: hypothetical protein MJ225_00215 [Bacilli bacterium]|nr:hypothetical protein [Bacilli bacterium]
MDSATRNQENTLIMMVVYNVLVDFKFGEEKIVRDVKGLISDISGKEYDQVSDYVKDSVMITCDKYAEIVKAYVPYLKGWDWNRLPTLTQAILLASYTHFYFIEKIDKKIIINVAVNLAKKFIDDKQAKFINAILDHGVLDERK